MAVIRQVICEETGEVFDTLTDCAKSLNRTSAWIRWKINFHETVNGRHYKYGMKMWRDNKTGETRPIYNQR